MSAKNMKQLNIRIPEELYDSIREQADEAGLTISDFARERLAEEKEGDKEELEGNKENDLINFYRQAYRDQQDQLNQKNSQITELTRLMDQQQQLHLTSQQENKQLKVDLDQEHEQRQQIEYERKLIEEKEKERQILEDEQASKWWKFWK